MKAAFQNLAAQRRHVMREAGKENTAAAMATGHATSMHDAFTPMPAKQRSPRSAAARASTTDACFFAVRGDKINREQLIFEHWIAHMLVPFVIVIRGANGHPCGGAPMPMHMDGRLWMAGKKEGIDAMMASGIQTLLSKHM